MGHSLIPLRHLVAHLLLLLDHALADHLIDRRFDKARANPLAIAPPLAVVGVSSGYV
jgi:hypothetical protein